MIDLSTLPQPPEGSSFSLGETSVHYVPHPYAITEQHTKLCGSLTLDAESIARAESRGAHCGVVYSPVPGHHCKLPFSKHRCLVGLQVMVPQNTNIDSIPGLRVYLASIKDQVKTLGIHTFIFTTNDSQ